jgi:hypothetical protein
LADFSRAGSLSSLGQAAISENGQIHYAALNGLGRTSGSYPMDNTFDPVLADLIKTVLR